MRTNQLVLIESTPKGDADFRIDDRTREIGRQGIAAAREALRVAAEHKAA